jgi:hypothetical protein
MEGQARVVPLRQGIQDLKWTEGTYNHPVRFYTDGLPARGTR